MDYATLVWFQITSLPRKLTHDGAGVRTHVKAFTLSGPDVKRQRAGDNAHAQTPAARALVAVKRATDF